MSQKNFEQFREQMNQVFKPSMVLAKVRNFLPQLAASNAELDQKQRNPDYSASSSSDSGISVEKACDSGADTTATDYDSDDESSDSEMVETNDGPEQQPQNIQFEIYTFKDKPEAGDAPMNGEESDDDEEDISEDQAQLPTAFKRKRKTIREPGATNKKPRLIEEL